MKIIVKTKLIEIDKKFYIELRDHELHKQDLKIIYCKGKDYKTCYHLGEDYTILTKAGQKNGQVINTQRSMFYPYKTYLLIRFPWLPRGKVRGKQVDEKNIVYENNIAKLP